MEKPLITKETLDSATLDHWVDEFWFLYSEPDLERDLHKTWSMAIEDATRVGEAIRENKPKNCLKYLAHTFCWIASFVAKLERDLKVPQDYKDPNFEYKLSNVTWFKYKWECPKCHMPSCFCPVFPPELISREIEMKPRPRPPRPDSMNRWEDMFTSIYDHAHSIRSLDELGFHLLEEMGEVEEVIRRIATWTPEKKERQHEKKDLSELKEDLIREVADTVSWCFAIVRKIATDARTYQELEETYGEEQKTAQGAIVTPTLTLARVLWEEYERKDYDANGNVIKHYNEIRCPTCGLRPCELKKEDREVHWRLTDKQSSNEGHIL